MVVASLYATPYNAPMKGAATETWSYHYSAVIECWVLVYWPEGWLILCTEKQNESDIKAKVKALNRLYLS